MDLDQLLAAGAYVVAGFVDAPNTGAGVVRLGQLLASGDVVLTAEGDAFVATLNLAEIEDKAVKTRAKRTKAAPAAADPAAAQLDLPLPSLAEVLAVL